MNKIFIKAFAWNSSAAFLYKIILLVHQVLLYSVISHTLYGLQSTLFALIYTVIAITNFGFEETLLPFFSIACQSKQQFRQILFHFMLHMIAIACVASIFYFGLLYGPGEFLHNLAQHCNKNIILICSLLFFIESIKKTVIAMMQLAFFNKQIAWASLSMLCAYTVIVWAIFNIFGQLTLYTIFMPMLICSTLELGYLTYQIVQFYNSIATSLNFTNISCKIFYTQRIYNYVNQIVKTIYSPNSMTIFFAYLLGFQEAATIKFFSNIITLCYTCISKTIGVTTGAALSSMNQMPLINIQSFFKEITHRYFQMLGLFTLLITSIVGYAYYNSTITELMAWHIVLFFSISLLDQINVTYEQLFIVQRAANTLAFINGIGFILLSLSGWLYYAYGFNPMVLLWIMICSKITSLFILNLLSYRYWKISISGQ